MAERAGLSVLARKGPPPQICDSWRERATENPDRGHGDLGARPGPTWTPPAPCSASTRGGELLHRRTAVTALGIGAGASRVYAMAGKDTRGQHSHRRTAQRVAARRDCRCRE